MKGRIVKTENGWQVEYQVINSFRFLPLNPYEVKQIEEDAKHFDNIEARIAAYPDVEFVIEDFWETGMEEVIKVATLIKENDPLDFLTKQAQELNMGYGLSEAEYEKACYWFGRGIHAGRCNMIKELQPKRSIEIEYRCPKCGETENLHLNYDYSKQHRPVESVLCNECGEIFDGDIDLKIKR